jgi:hypothetical protein
MLISGRLHGWVLLDPHHAHCTPVYTKDFDADGVQRGLHEASKDRTAYRRLALRGHDDAKAVEDEIAAAGAVPDGIDYERERLDRGVGKLIEPICTKHVRPGIGPDVAAVTCFRPAGRTLRGRRNPLRVHGLAP